MKLNKEKYFRKIEIRKFKNASPFKEKRLIVDNKEVGVVINIVNNKDDFNSYVLDLNEIDENIGYLIIPTLKIKYTQKFFDVFDLFLLDHNMYIINKYSTYKELENHLIYYKNVLILKKNISKIISLDIGSKINISKLFKY